MLVEDNPDKKYVISDVRFQNEVNFIKQYRGIIIKIIRKPLNNDNNEHISEYSIDKLYDIDYLIQNNSTIEILPNKVACLCDDILNNFNQ